MTTEPEKQDYLLVKLSEATAYFNSALASLSEVKKEAIRLIKSGECTGFYYFLDCKFLVAMIKDIKVYLRNLIIVH